VLLPVAAVLELPALELPEVLVPESLLPQAAMEITIVAAIRHATNLFFIFTLLVLHYTIPLYV
jgi:hypothetical protein